MLGFRFKRKRSLWLDESDYILVLQFPKNRKTQTYPKGSKYPNEGYEGFLCLESQFWFGVDTLNVGTWILGDKAGADKRRVAKVCCKCDQSAAEDLHRQVPELIVHGGRTSSPVKTPIDCAL